MRCLVCGKAINPIRRLFDSKYCCDRHRKTARKLSARALRDAHDADELEEPWLITAGLKGEGKRSVPGTGFSPASGILLIVVIIFVVLVAPPSNRFSPTARPLDRPFPLSDRLKNLLPGRPSLDFTEDFRGGLGDWIGRAGASAAAAGWDWEGNRVRLGNLRLWKPTVKMTDYRFLFQGEIETKAIGWAFRASDLNNYYAAKISLHEPNKIRRAEIIRYVVVDGRQTDRVTLPLPFQLEENKPYQVQVRIKADRFSTMINGQTVDTWRDERHRQGGVGFFCDPGEKALISWVQVTDGGDLLDRLLSFSLLVTPGTCCQRFRSSWPI